MSKALIIELPSRVSKGGSTQVGSSYVKIDFTVLR